jgi:hypothetical protein
LAVIAVGEIFRRILAVSMMQSEKVIPVYPFIFGDDAKTEHLNSD